MLDTPVAHDDQLDSFWLSETLKCLWRLSKPATPPQQPIAQARGLAPPARYLWLLYATDDVLPLDAWTFSTEAHPLPVASSAALLARQPPTDYLDLVTRSRLTPWTLAGVVVCVLVGVFIMGAVDAFHAAASIHGAMAAAQRLATRYWARLRG